MKPRWRKCQTTNPTTDKNEKSSSHLHSKRVYSPEDIGMLNIAFLSNTT